MSDPACKTVVDGLFDLNRIIQSPREFHSRVRSDVQLMEIVEHLRKLQMEPALSHCSVVLEEGEPGLDIYSFIDTLIEKTLSYRPEYQLPPHSPRLIHTKRRQG
jgi:hypothetical protein